MVHEREVLLGVEDLEECGGGVAAEVRPQLVHLVQHEDRVAAAGPPEPLDDLTRKGADVGAAVTADLRLVPDAAERQSMERSSHGARDRLAERSLAGAGRADEAQDRSPGVGLEPAHRQVLEDAVLHQLEVVVIRVQDPARLLQLDLVLAQFRPRKGDQPVEVGAADDVLSRGRRHRPQPVQLAIGRLPGGRRHAGLLDLLPELLVRGLVLVPLAQLLLDGLELLPQDELPLPLLDLVLHVLLDLAPQLHDADLTADVPGQLQQTLADRESLEEFLLVGRVAYQEGGGQIGQSRRALDVQEGDAELVGGDRHERQHLADLGLQVLDQGLDLDRLLDLLRQETDLEDQVRLGPDGAGEPDAVEAADQDPDRAVGELQHPLDDGCGADLVQILLRGLLDGGVLLQDQADHAVLDHDLVDELDGRRAAHDQGSRYVREDHGPLQRRTGRDAGSARVAGEGGRSWSSTGPRTVVSSRPCSDIAATSSLRLVDRHAARAG